MTYSMEDVAQKHFASRDPKHINAGDCWKWAFYAIAMHGGSLRCSRTHVFVMRDGLFYDAEAPFGVSSYAELPYYVRRGDDFVFMPRVSDFFFNAELGDQMRTLALKLGLVQPEAQQRTVLVSSDNPPSHVDNETRVG